MKISKKSLLFSSIIIFITFVFFSFLVHKNLFTNFDFNTTVKLQDHVSQKFDNAFSFLSLIGNVEIVGIVLFVILLLHRKIKGIIVLFLFGFFHLFEIYGKVFVKHFPPPHFMLRTHDLFNYPKFYIREQNSYPSGHAARALFLTTILALLIFRSKRIPHAQKLIFYILLGVYDIAMLTSRVYLGEHWTSDVIGGSFLGLTFGLLSGVFL